MPCNCDQTSGDKVFCERHKVAKDLMARKLCHNDPEVRALWDEGMATAFEPPLIKKMQNWASESKEALNHWGRKRKIEEVLYIHDNFCSLCPHNVNSTCIQIDCGCPILTESHLLSKLAIGECPIKLWVWDENNRTKYAGNPALRPPPP